MKLTDIVKAVHQSGDEIVQTKRAYLLNAALMEMHLMGIITKAQELSIGKKLDMLFDKHKSELANKDI